MLYVSGKQLRACQEGQLLNHTVLVRVPAVGLIMLLRPKGLKVHSYVEKYVEFKKSKS